MYHSDRCSGISVGDALVLVRATLSPWPCHTRVDDGEIYSTRKVVSRRFPSFPVVSRRQRFFRRDGRETTGLKPPSIRVRRKGPASDARRYAYDERVRLKTPRRYAYDERVRLQTPVASRTTKLGNLSKTTGNDAIFPSRRTGNDGAKTPVASRTTKGSGFRRPSRRVRRKGQA